jgi:hypothetical protein
MKVSHCDAVCRKLASTADGLISSTWVCPKSALVMSRLVWTGETAGRIPLLRNDCLFRNSRPSKRPTITTTIALTPPTGRRIEERVASLACSLRDEFPFAPPEEVLVASDVGELVVVSCAGGELSLLGPGVVDGVL